MYESKHVVKKSEFIANLSFVNSEDDAIKFVEKIRSEHPKSRHIAYVWWIDNGREYLKINDDGEPSGTAGAPIYSILKHNNIKNVVVTVTRYWGGKKLGASGLIRAYGKPISTLISQNSLSNK